MAVFGNVLVIVKTNELMVSYLQVDSKGGDNQEQTDK
jgi:hypothetical protein